jgi:hypothetical protein
MVKTQELTKEQQQTLKTLAEHPITGPCCPPSINTAEIAALAQQIRVDVKKKI